MLLLLRLLLLLAPASALTASAASCCYCYYRQRSQEPGLGPPNSKKMRLFPKDSGLKKWWRCSQELFFMTWKGARAVPGPGLAGGAAALVQILNVHIVSSVERAAP